MVEIAISIKGDAWPEDFELSSLTQRVVEASLRYLGFEAIDSELSVLFTQDAEIQAINKQWRGHDKPTNVLAFPVRDMQIGEKPGPLLGDIVIAYETVHDEAKAQCKSLSDHLAHMVVHGFLHLLGYDHQEDAEAEHMEMLEVRILDSLGVSDPYVKAAKSP